jgi:hypothetical protein
MSQSLVGPIHRVQPKVRREEEQIELVSHRPFDSIRRIAVAKELKNEENITVPLIQQQFPI